MTTLLQLITPASPCRVLNVRDHALNWHKDNEVQVAQGDFHLHKYYPGRHSLEMIRIQNKAIHSKQEKKVLEFLGCSREKPNKPGICGQYFGVMEYQGYLNVFCIWSQCPYRRSLSGGLVENSVSIAWSLKHYCVWSILVHPSSMRQIRLFNIQQEPISVGREKKNTRRNRSRDAWGGREQAASIPNRAFSWLARWLRKCRSHFHDKPVPPSSLKPQLWSNAQSCKNLRIIARPRSTCWLQCTKRISQSVWISIPWWCHAFATRWYASSIRGAVKADAFVFIAF